MGQRFTSAVVRYAPLGASNYYSDLETVADEALKQEYRKHDSDTSIQYLDPKNASAAVTKRKRKAKVKRQQNKRKQPL